MKKKKKKRTLPSGIGQAASMTECTGLLPAQVEGDGEIGALSELMQVPLKPPEEGR